MAETPADRIAQAFELFEFGLQVMSATLRRRHPDASAAQIDELLSAWLAEAPSATPPELVVSTARFR